jgi:hypothetical protein
MDLTDKVIVNPLPDNFEGVGEVHGFSFNKLKGVLGKKYLYEVSSEGFIHYEVIKPILTMVAIDFINHIFSKTDVSERYPKANLFGMSGWTYKSLNDAETKYTSI